MRVGVDGFNLAMPRGTGVATYGRVLTQALTAAGHEIDMLYGMNMGPRTPRLLREIIFFDSLDSEKHPAKPIPFTPRWFRELRYAALPAQAIEVPVTGRVIAETFATRMPAYDRILNVQDLFRAADRYFKRWNRFLTVRVPNPPAVMHWTYPLPIRLEGARNIYTIHDLVPLRLPYTTLDNKRLYLRLIRGCLRWGDHVCTVSEASRADIMALLGVPGDRVTNTYQSATHAAPLRNPQELAGWLAGLFGLEPQGYFLFFGALEPKKNVGRLLEAYLGSGLSTPLVIIGGRAWKSESELRLIRPDVVAPGQVGAAQRVRQMDYVPGAWLAGLIQGARAVMFPSLYEGFGLPVLEAMQLGTPVLTSTESSLPEVAGDAALMVNPYKVADMTAALQQLDTDPALRDRLAAAGPIQAKRFAMEPYQARLAALYDAVLAGPAGVSIVAGRDTGWPDAPTR